VPIYISASLIEDYISCNRKAFYRTNKSEDAIPSPEMVIGEIVHKSIELFWNNEPLSQGYYYGEMVKRLPNESIEYGSHCLHNYHRFFQPLLLPEDTIEVKFKLPFSDGVYIVGMMDRISNGNIFDWKTARNPVRNISTTIQFVLYNWAYKKLYKSNPAGVYYAALSTGSLVRFNYNPVVEDALVGELIPMVIQDIKNKKYLRNGMFRKSCYKCQYSNTCLRDIGGSRELDMSNNTKE
jgi:hypothetical protein